jgi:transcriptional regulator with XRE-family HTH domain
VNVDPNELRQRLADDLRQAMASAQPTAEELGRRAKRGPPIQGIKAAELAARLGVGYDAMLDWLRGDTEPSRDNRLKLCDFLGITEDVYIARYLLGSVTPPEPHRTQPGVEARVEELASALSELTHLSSEQAAEIARLSESLRALAEERGETG